ncbi:MAG: 6-hydroxymethylpterin diphosphokinase MptE-like protein [Cyanobacteria bacterium P01_H01_bin.74]
MFWEKNRTALLANPCSQVGSQIATQVATQKTAPQSPPFENRSSKKHANKSLADRALAKQSVVQKLDQTLARNDIQLVETEQGDYTLLVPVTLNNRYHTAALHAKTGAMAEAQAVTEKSIRPSLSQIHLILGIGLGYVLDGVAKASPGHILVFEPDLALLRYVLENVDLAHCLKQPRIQVFTTTADLVEAVAQRVQQPDPLDVIVTQGEAFRLSSSIQTLMPELLQTVETRVREFETGKFFHQQWLQGFYSNLRALTPCKLLASQVPLRDESNVPVPAILIGRGPSLNGTHQQLALARQNNVLLIAAGSALRYLHNGGIKPHCAVFYDVNGVREQLHDIPDHYFEDIVFFINPVIPRHQFPASCQNKVLFIPQYLTQTAQAVFSTVVSSTPFDFSSVHCLEGGGTVSMVALQLALLWQCSPIALLGQDLAFPGNQVYAEDVHITKDQKGRLALPASATLFTAPEAMDTVLGQSGEPLPTLKAYKDFIQQFEATAKRLQKSGSDSALFNCSLGGAQINGFSCVSLTDFLKKISVSKNSKQAISNDKPACFSLSFPDFPDTETGLLAVLDTLQKKLNAALKTLSPVLEANKIFESEKYRIDHALDHWAQNKAAYQAMLDALQADPIVADCLKYQLLALKSQLIPNPKTADEALKALTVFQKFATASQAAITELLHTLNSNLSPKTL